MPRPLLLTDVPLIWLDNGRLQVGDTDVILRNVTPATLTWLRAFDGVHTWPELLACTPHDAATTADLVAALQSGGALADADSICDRLRLAPQDERVMLQQTHGALTVTYRSASIADRIMSARGVLRVQILGDGAIAEHLHQLVADQGFVIVCQSPDVVFIARAAHPDVIDEADIPDRHVVHLPVVGSGGRAHVGPLVLPGSSSCVRCAELYRTDANPAWPRIAVQHAARRQHLAAIDPALAGLAAAHAATWLATWHDRVVLALPTAPLINRSTYLLSPDGRAEQVSRPVHPLCGCRWRQPGRAETSSTGDNG